MPSQSLTSRVTVPANDYSSNAERLPVTAWLVPSKNTRAVRAFELRARHVHIGRDAACALTLEDGLVSREHAKIVYLGHGRYAVIDLGSLNGTWVNGKCIDRTTLHDGDSIQIGRASWIFKSIR